MPLVGSMTQDDWRVQLVVTVGNTVFIHRHESSVVDDVKAIHMVILEVLHEPIIVVDLEEVLAHQH